MKKRYKQEELVEKAGVRLGVVTHFRKTLKEKGLLSNKVLLSDVHLFMLIAAKELRDSRNLHWQLAFDKVMKNFKYENLDVDYLEDSKFYSISDFSKMAGVEEEITIAIKNYIVNTFHMTDYNDKLIDIFTTMAEDIKPAMQKWGFSIEDAVKYVVPLYWSFLYDANEYAKLSRAQVI